MLSGTWYSSTSRELVLSWHNVPDLKFRSAKWGCGWSLTVIGVKGLRANLLSEHKLSGSPVGESWLPALSEPGCETQTLIDCDRSHVTCLLKGGARKRCQPSGRPTFVGNFCSPTCRAIDAITFCTTNAHGMFHWQMLFAMHAAIFCVCRNIPRSVLPS